MLPNSKITHYGTQIFGKKWRIDIVYVLKDGPTRFSQIKSKLDGCSVKVLSEALQDLGYHRIVLRRQYNTIPVKVTYELAKSVTPYISLVTSYMDFIKAHICANPDLYDCDGCCVEETYS